MESFEHEIQLIRDFHYSVDLPIALLVKGNCVYSLPDRIIHASDVSDNPDFFPTFENSGKVQYLQTDSSENYVCLKLENGICVLAGPFLTQSVSTEFVSELVRSGKLALKYKNALIEHFSTLPVISQQKYFHIGKLIESLFISSCSISNMNDENAEYETQFILPEYYKQAQDYRFQQFLHSPYTIEEEICHAISQGEKESARHILKEINMRPRARLAGSTIRSLKNSLICSCTFMARAAISGGVAPDEAFTLSDAFIQTIEKTQDAKVLLNLEEQMVVEYSDAVNRLKGKRYSNYVNQAIVYIELHLCEAITVKDISSSVYISPNYLSSLFQEETGETVHNYIVKRRIEESSFFVENSTDPIADIASFYKFCSQSHYVQSFKKIKGVTPGVYRKRKQQLKT